MLWFGICLYVTSKEIDWEERLQNKLDGSIVWNEHNTVFGSKRSAIYAQDIYFIHSMMPSVSYL